MGIEPSAVHLQLNLTPGLEVAEAVIADIDGNRDGSLSTDEQRAYAVAVVRALTLEVDATPVGAALAGSTFPDAGAMRRGEGTIQLVLTGTLPRLAPGSHQLRFQNRHQPQRSVYLANALVPASHQVAITGQQRNEIQSELAIDYVLRAAPARSTAAWLLGGLAVAAGLTALRLGRTHPGQ